MIGHERTPQKGVYMCMYGTGDLADIPDISAQAPSECQDRSVIATCRISPSDRCLMTRGTNRRVREIIYILRKHQNLSHVGHIDRSERLDSIDLSVSDC